MDQIFRVREVPNGQKVNVLLKGNPLTEFNTGGKKEKELERYLSEQKVAGNLILEYGKIRMEKYALGFTEYDREKNQLISCYKIFKSRSTLS